MRLSGIALLALLAGTAAANAADLNWNSNNSAPIYSSTSVAQWNGFYAGVNGGYAFGQTEISNGNGAGITGQKPNTGGWLGGAQAGYNMDMGGFVLGAEGDVQFGGPSHKESLAGATGTYETKTDFFGTVRGRVGVPVGQVMPYATAGVAFGRGTAEIKEAATTTSTNANHLGWAAGVGIEAQATSNISVKAEYLYVDLGTQGYGSLPTVGGRDVTQRFSTVRAGVNYKF